MPVLSHWYETTEVLGCYIDVNGLTVALIPEPKTCPARGMPGMGVRAVTCGDNFAACGPTGASHRLPHAVRQPGMQHCCLMQHVLPLATAVSPSSIEHMGLVCWLPAAESSSSRV